MAKLSIHNFYDLPKEQRESIISEFGEYFSPDYLNDKYSRNEVNVEVALDEDGNLYDARVFDPYQLVDKGVYINPDGWSNWLYDYHDPSGLDIDEIFDQRNGYVFSEYLVQDERDSTLYYVYLKDIEKYWVEKYGQESWEKVEFADEISDEVQSENPELYALGHGSNDRGEYLTLTTDENAEGVGGLW